MSSSQPRLPRSFHALCTELAAEAFPDASPMTTASYALQVVAAVGRAQFRSLPFQARLDLAGADLAGRPRQPLNYQESFHATGQTRR